MNNNYEIIVDRKEAIYKAFDIANKDDIVLKEGDFISLDGSTGIVYLGDVAKVETAMTGNFEKLMNIPEHEIKIRNKNTA